MPVKNGARHCRKDARHAREQGARYCQKDARQRADGPIPADANGRDEHANCGSTQPFPPAATGTTVLENRQLPSTPSCPTALLPKSVVTHTVVKVKSAPAHSGGRIRQCLPVLRDRLDLQGLRIRLLQQRLNRISVPPSTTSISRLRPLTRRQELLSDLLLSLTFHANFLPQIQSRCTMELNRT